ncbi:MAG: hypothetical protein ACJ77E_16745 [Gaiellaceae bacterium]
MPVFLTRADTSTSPFVCAPVALGASVTARFGVPRPAVAAGAGGGGEGGGGGGEVAVVAGGGGGGGAAVVVGGALVVVGAVAVVAAVGVRLARPAAAAEVPTAAI